jgi:signal transduction histidine kinase/DNA-binding response OmpR family regulator
MGPRDTVEAVRPTVLIVDDKPEKLLALESTLLSLDVDIVTTQSGREALRRLLERDVAVVLLDVRMPGMDGFETATLIRQRQRSANTPIIFITAFTEETHVAKGYELRAVDYIMAPVVPEILRTKVSVLVELYRATAEVRRQAESLRRRTTQLHQLTLAAMALNSAASIEAMVALAATSAVEILDAECVTATAEVDDHRTHHAAGPARRTGVVQAFDSPVADDVRRTNGVVRRAWTEPAGERYDVLGVPLIGRTGANIGAIEVARRAEVPFDREDQDLVVQLAQMTSIAVENAVFAEAREANRLKDEFISAVSHELRTPLNALRSWAWVLRQQALPPEKVATVAEAIERSVGAQARIVDDLLDVSRIMTGKMSLRFEALDLRPLVEAAVDSLESLARAQGLRIIRAIAPQRTVVAGDGDRLQQVVANLVSNAIKFTPSGGCIDVALAVDGRNAVVRVSDTGCGIAPSFLPHVFERFRQADGSIARRAGGLGVGLTIARQLVEMHGGEIAASSEGEGRGATFTVTLPVLDESRADVATPAEAGAARLRLDGMRILLVEDDPDTREAMTLILSDAGAAVATSVTAEDAMRRLLGQPFDVLLCDIGLPGEDGCSLVRRLRTLVGPVSRLPAIALTAFAHERDQQRARDAGFDGHVAKPVDPTMVLRTLAELMQPRRAVVAAAGPLGVDARMA